MEERPCRPGIQSLRGYWSRWCYLTSPGISEGSNEYDSGRYSVYFVHCFVARSYNTWYIIGNQIFPNCMYSPILTCLLQAIHSSRQARFASSSAVIFFCTADWRIKQFGGGSNLKMQGILQLHPSFLGHSRPRRGRSLLGRPY